MTTWDKMSNREKVFVTIVDKPFFKMFINVQKGSMIRDFVLIMGEIFLYSKFLSDAMLKNSSIVCWLKLKKIKQSC